MEETDTTQRTQATPGTNTWYNIGSANLGITLPIGSWKTSYSVLMAIAENSATSTGWFGTTLSTANNSESDSQMTDLCLIQGSSANMFIGKQFNKEKNITVSSKTTYYLNGKAESAGIDNIYFRNEKTPMVVRAISAYL